ncbi:MAG: FkbM family methyltransferase [Pseudomonadota bacterium]
MAQIGGIARSLWVYHGKPRLFGVTSRPDLTDIYAPFVKRGDLVFDIGSHVGDRVSAFRKLGARVVAVEPQPALQNVLRALYGDSPSVTLVNAAVSDRPGTNALHLNTGNPTVATLSDDFIAAAEGAEGWEDQRWDDVVDVATITLADLTETYGRPAFIKVDVEGFEDRVLAGMAEPAPALSFEFTTIERDVAARALDVLVALEPRYRFSASFGESHVMIGRRWMTADAIGAWLDRLPQAANSGDIYARLMPD